MLIAMPPTPFTYKTNKKLKVEGFQSPSHSMLRCHINEENGWFANANTQRPLWLEGKISLLGVDCDKGHL
jgi:hypothetical protein